MNGRAKFVYWLVTGYKDLPDEPMFNVIKNERGLPNGSTIGGEQLLSQYGIAVPLFPDLKTWKRETELKRRCFRCWAVTRGAADNIHHRQYVHGEQFTNGAQLVRAIGRLGQGAVLLLCLASIGCNSVRHLTGLDRHDATPTNNPVATGIIRQLPASSGISFSPDQINGAPANVRVFVKNADWLTATPGAWYEIPWVEVADGRTTEYAVISFVGQSAVVYNQPSGSPRAITVESVPVGAFDPGRPAQ